MSTEYESAMEIKCAIDSLETEIGSIDEKLEVMAWLMCVKLLHEPGLGDIHRQGICVVLDEMRPRVLRRYDRQAKQPVDAETEVGDA